MTDQWQIYTRAENSFTATGHPIELQAMIPKPQRRNYARHHSRHRNLWKVPSILFSDGLVACACWNSHTTYGWKKSGFLMAIITTMMFTSILLPYIFAISTHALPAFLPFISHAGGTPPMNGVFAVLLIIMAFIGIFPFVILYESINHRNVRQLKKIKTYNKIALPVMLMTCLGLVITAANPIGYTQFLSKFEWLVTVLFEHGLGASMILFGAALYQFSLTRIWFLLPDTTTIAKYLKLSLSVGFVLLFLTSLQPMPRYLLDELGPEPFNIPLLKNTSYELPLVFTTSYKISAFCEWAVIALAGLNFITLYKDLQRISFHVILRHKSCFKDTLEPAPSITMKSLP